MNDLELRQIYEAVLNGNQSAVGQDPGAPSPSRRFTFRRVYKAPGYPVEPRNNATRAVDAYVNAFAPQPQGVYDAAPLRQWLVDNIN